MASAPESYKHRIEHIYCLEDRLNNLSEGNEIDLSNYALADHTHSGYASSSHTHSQYALTSHTHDCYALCGHCHTEYALQDHGHSEYACWEHTHDDYALTSHTHSNYALKTHNHDSVYSKLGHTHDFTDYGCAICKLKCAIRTLDTYLATITGPFTDKYCAEFYASQSPYLCAGQTLLEFKGFSEDYHGTVPETTSAASHENTVISE